MTKLETLCEAIKTQEGWKKGSRSWRNNNPGNLKFSKYQRGHDGTFSVFESFSTGWLGLVFDIFSKCCGNTSTKLNGESTLYELFEVWAPDNDGNNSKKYAENVAKFCEVSPMTKLKEFLK